MVFFIKLSQNTVSVSFWATVLCGCSTLLWCVYYHNYNGNVICQGIQLTYHVPSLMTFLHNLYVIYCILFKFCTWEYMHNTNMYASDGFPVKIATVVIFLIQWWHNDDVINIAITGWSLWFSRFTSRMCGNWISRNRSITAYIDL